MPRGNSGKVAVAFALAAVVGIVAFQPLLGAVNQNSGSQDITNETITASSGEYVPLSGYDIFEDSEIVRVYNESSDSYEQVAEGSDYEMRYGAGSLKALESSSSISTGDTLKVSYRYQASDGFTETIIGYIPVVFAVVLLFVVFRGVKEVS